MILTIAKLDSLRSSEAGIALHDWRTPVMPEAGEAYFLGYVPVTWDDVAPDSIEDADDWKEVDVVTTATESEALAALRAVYGDLAEIELIHRAA